MEKFQFENTSINEAVYDDQHPLRGGGSNVQRRVHRWNYWLVNEVLPPHEAKPKIQNQ